MHIEITASNIPAVLNQYCAESGAVKTTRNNAASKNNTTEGQRKETVQKNQLPEKKLDVTETIHDYRSSLTKEKKAANAERMLNAQRHQTSE